MASPVDTSVKMFNEGMYGAPVLNGVAGAFIGLLDACLINGFGVRTPTSITVAGGVATVLLPSEIKNQALLDTVILVSGVTGSKTDLNGEQKIIAANLTELKFATAVADGAATGTLSVKTAPVPYWEKTYSTTNVAVYRSTHPASFGAYLRADDTNATNVLVRMYEAMSDHSTGTNQAPTVADTTDAFWSKSTGANSTPVNWDFFADGRRFHYCPVPRSGSALTNVGQAVFTFGDINSFKSVDPFAVWIGTSVNNSQVGYGNSLFGAQGGVSQGPSRLLRSYTSLGVAIQAYCVPMSGGITFASGVDAMWGTFPTVDGRMRLARMMVTEGATNGASSLPRGSMPGLWYVPHTGGQVLFPRGTRTVVNGRQLYCIRPSNASTDEATAAGYGWVDISGPWSL